MENTQQIGKVVVFYPVGDDIESDIHVFTHNNERIVLNPDSSLGMDLAGWFFDKSEDIMYTTFGDLVIDNTGSLTFDLDSGKVAINFDTPVMVYDKNDNLVVWKQKSPYVCHNLRQDVDSDVFGVVYHSTLSRISAKG